MAAPGLTRQPGWAREPTGGRAADSSGACRERGGPSLQGRGGARWGCLVRCGGRGRVCSSNRVRPGGERGSGPRKAGPLAAPARLPGPCAPRPSLDPSRAAAGVQEGEWGRGDGAWGCREAGREGKDLQASGRRGPLSKGAARGREGPYAGGEEVAGDLQDFAGKALADPWVRKGQAVADAD